MKQFPRNTSKACQICGSVEKLNGQVFKMLQMRLAGRQALQRLPKPPQDEWSWLHPEPSMTKTTDEEGEAGSRGRNELKLKETRKVNRARPS